MVVVVALLASRMLQWRQLLLLLLLLIVSQTYVAAYCVLWINFFCFVVIMFFFCFNFGEHHHSIKLCAVHFVMSSGFIFFCLGLFGGYVVGRSTGEEGK